MLSLPQLEARPEITGPAGPRPSDGPGAAPSPSPPASGSAWACGCFAPSPPLSPRHVPPPCVSVPSPPVVRTEPGPPEIQEDFICKDLFPDKATRLGFQVGVNLGSTTSATAASLQCSVGAHVGTHMGTHVGTHIHTPQKWTTGSEEAGHSLCHFFSTCLNMMPGANSVPTDDPEQNRSETNSEKSIHLGLCRGPHLSCVAVPTSDSLPSPRLPGGNVLGHPHHTAPSTERWVCSFVLFWTRGHRLPSWSWPGTALTLPSTAFLPRSPPSPPDRVLFPCPSSLPHEGTGGSCCSSGLFPRCPPVGPQSQPQGPGSVLRDTETVWIWSQAEQAGPRLVERPCCGRKGRYPDASAGLSSSEGQTPRGSLRLHTRTSRPRGGAWQLTCHATFREQ